MIEPIDKPIICACCKRDYHQDWLYRYESFCWSCYLMCIVKDEGGMSMDELKRVVLVQRTLTKLKH